MKHLFLIMWLPVCGITVFGCGESVEEENATDPLEPAEDFQDSGDGKIIFVSDRDGETTFWTMNSDGSDQTRLGFNLGEIWPAKPDWSPDGTQITFGNVGVMDVDDGSDLRDLTDWNDIEHGPQWSPDGKKIAFNRVIMGPLGFKTTAVHVMDADGTNLKLLANVTWSSSIRWSPSGKQIAYTSPCCWDVDNPDWIFVVDADKENVLDHGTHDLSLVAGENPPFDTVLLVGFVDENTIFYLDAVKGVHGVKPIARNLSGGIASFFLGGMGVPGHRHISRFQTPHGFLLLGEANLSPALDEWGKHESIIFSAVREDPMGGDFWAQPNWEIYRLILDTDELIQLTDTAGKNHSPDEWKAPLPVQPQ